MTMPPRYARDMTGYGARPPAAAWPGGARIAVQFVINYEEGGENNVLHGDAASEAFLSEIVGAAPWPGQRHWNMELIYEYGARAGFWRLHRLFTGMGIPATVYGVATALARSPEQVAAMAEAGWEIASHGLKWIEYRDMPAEDGARAPPGGHPPSCGGHGRPPARLVPGALLDEHGPPRGRGRRLRLHLRQLRRRPALLDQRGRPRPAHHPLHARRQRHALRHAPGLQRGRPVRGLSQGQLRRAPCRRRADDVRGPPLPADRPPGPDHGAEALHGLRGAP